MIRKTITYSSFIVAGLVLVAAFVTATTYTQLGVAVLFYPFLAILAFKIFPNKAWKAPVLTIKMPSLGVEKMDTETTTQAVRTVAVPEKVGISDIDRRAFLKLIGAAGVSLFLYSVFIKRAESAFFGKAAGPETVSVKDTQDRKIDPAEKQPTDGYRICEVDDNITSYFGFVNKDGAWFIMQEDTDSGSFRYTRGDFNFARGWERRERLSYNYYNEVF